MNIETVNNLEIEKDRQERIVELATDQGADWLETCKPGSFGCHELLDRTAQAADTVEKFILAHPACVQNPDWYALADQAVAALNELYQRVGAVHLEAGTRPTI